MHSLTYTHIFPPSLSPLRQSTDKWTGRLVDTLKAKGMWKNSALLYSADNGGTDLGSNWPLRGSKHTNWEGGMRAAAFISGGIVPEHARGTHSQVISHIADWYTTACVLGNGGYVSYRFLSFNLFDLLKYQPQSV